MTTTRRRRCITMTWHSQLVVRPDVEDSFLSDEQLTCEACDPCCRNDQHRDPVVRNDVVFERGRDGTDGHGGERASYQATGDAKLHSERCDDRRERGVEDDKASVTVPRRLTELPPVSHVPDQKHVRQDDADGHARQRVRPAASGRHQHRRRQAGIADRGQEKCQEFQHWPLIVRVDSLCACCGLYFLMNVTVPTGTALPLTTK